MDFDEMREDEGNDIEYRSPQEDRRKPRQVVGSEFRGLPDAVPVLSEPLMNVLETRFDVGLWLVPKDFSRLVDRGKQTGLLVPVSALAEHDPCLIVSELVHPVREIKNFRFLTRGKIDRLANGPFY